MIDYEEPNMTREDAFRAFMMYESRSKVTPANIIHVILSKRISPLKDPQGDLEETAGARLARDIILNDRSK